MIRRRDLIKRGAAVAGTAALLPLVPWPAIRALGEEKSATPAGSASVPLKTLLDQMHGGGGYGEHSSSDLSVASFAQELAATQALLKQADAIDRAQLTKDETIDLRFATSILRGRELAQASMERWKKDPRIYLQLRSLSVQLALPNPDAARAKDVTKALNEIPTHMANGQKNLEVNIPRFRELSLFMVDNILAVFKTDVPAFAAQVPASKAEVLQANDAALASVLAYQAFLRDDLPKKPTADFSIGRKIYDEMLAEQYMLDYNADTLYAFAWEQFNSTVAQCEAVAKTIAPGKPWLEVAAAIKEEGPDPLTIIEAHQMWVDKARVHVDTHKLVPIPWKNRVDVVPRAEYLRKTSYYGNFSMPRKADAEGVFVGQWQINTFLPTWSDAEKRQYMLEHDWGVIIDTAPHETYCGHHVQGLYQLHNGSNFRRTSSISIFSEGWGLYIERVMQETGFFPSEKIHLRNLQLRLWRIARVIWDVGMNSGKLTYEQAVTLLVERVGFQRWAAELEVDYAAEHPGYQLGYFMGYSGIVNMREEFKQVRGDQFTLSDFHERLLKVGCMPPKLMREGLMNSLSTANAT
jgi:uncharacterized protein (DUF885 family)